jgi:hypothetical protein
MKADLPVVLPEGNTELRIGKSKNRKWAEISQHKPATTNLALKEISAGRISDNVWYRFRETMGDNKRNEYAEKKEKNLWLSTKKRFWAV